MRSAFTKRRLAGVATALAAVAAAGAMALTGTAPLARADDSSGTTPAWPWLNTALPAQERAALLVSELTVPEKVAQFGDSDGAVKRGDDTILPAYNYWSEALHGVVAGGTTMFPSPTGIGSSWNRSLVNEIGTVIGDEGRAENNTTGKGLTYWAPNLNVDRDPRWGRADETYSEDPYLVGQLGTQFIRGAEGSNPNYLKIASTPKHYFANNSESNRRNGTSNLTVEEMREFYTASFQQALSPVSDGGAGAASFMTAYNSVQLTDAPASQEESMTRGVPMSYSTLYDTTMPTRQWGFTGYVTSDCSAISDGYNRHAWAPVQGADATTTAQNGVAWALKASTDIDCQDNSYSTYLQGAYNRGLVTDADIDAQLTRLLTVRFELGEFDPKSDVPYENTATYGADQIASPQNQAIATEASDEAPVLLKNDPVGGLNSSSTGQKALPLDASKIQNLAVVGYMSKEFTAGGYSGSNQVDTRTMYDGIVEAAKAKNPNMNIEYFDGVTPTNVEKPSFIGVDFYGADQTDPTLGDSTANPPVAATTPLREILSSQTQNGYPSSISDNPAINQFVLWEGYMGINWGYSDYMEANNVNGGYVEAYVDVPTDATQVAIQMSGATNAIGATYDCHVGAIDGPLCGSMPVINGNSTTKHVCYGSWGCFDQVTSTPKLSTVAYTGPTGPQHLFFVYNEGKLGAYGTAGQPGTPVATDMQSCSDDACDGPNDADTAEYKIKHADAVIVVDGSRTNEAAEEMDRVNTNWGNFQDQMTDQVAKWNPNTVVYMQTMGLMDIEAFRNDVPAIVWSNYDGQAQGQAAGNVLFGNVNPSGHLTFSWYSDVSKDLPSLWDYQITQDADHSGRTYQYTNAQVSYPFGHGLSYSTFTVGNLKLSSQSLTGDDTLNASVDVTNTSNVPGQDVIQLYVTSPKANANDAENNGVVRPIRQLKGFDKVSLAAGQTKTVTIPVKMSDLWFWDTAANTETWDTGTWMVQVGDESAKGPESSFKLTSQPSEQLDVVATVPDGVSLNTNAPDAAIHANLSATTTDMAFLDLSDPSVKVAYSVADPSVAKVDAHGTVLPVAKGSTMVTASVTYNGVTKTSSFPVVVEGDDASEPVMNLADQTVQLSNASKIENPASVKLLPTGDDVTGISYQIAPMDAGYGDATIDATSGILSTTKAGTYRITATATISNYGPADSDGNPTDGYLSRSAIITVVPDQPTPVVKITTPAAPASGTFTGDVQVNVSATVGSYSTQGTQLQYSVDGGAWQDVTGPITVSGDGTHTVDARATDDLGQTGTAQAKIVIDTTAPDAADVTAVAADGTLTLTAPDGVTLEYSPNGSVWAPYTGPVAITGVVYYRAIDAAGNASAPKFVEVPAQPVVVSVPGATKVVEVQVPQIVNTEKVVTVNAAALSKLASTRPVIKGKAKAGKTLKVKKGAWTAGAKLTVKWYVNGKKVTTASKFKVKHAYKGKRIVAKVTGSKSGYKTVTRASKTVKIKK